MSELSRSRRSASFGGSTPASGGVGSGPMEAVTTVREERDRSDQPASSFAKSLFCGEIHEDMVFPWPEPDAAEQDRVRGLIDAARAIGERIDPREIEERRWLGAELVRDLGEAGLCGLY